MNHIKRIRRISNIIHQVHEPSLTFQVAMILLWLTLKGMFYFDVLIISNDACYVGKPW